MLGPEQERWVRQRLSSARTRWKVLGQQTLMAQLDQKAGAGEAWRSDGWDGYPAAASNNCINLEPPPTQDGIRSAARRAYRSRRRN